MKYKRLANTIVALILILSLFGNCTNAQVVTAAPLESNADDPHEALLAPTIGVDPTFFDETVLVDTPKVMTLDVMNVGDGVLTWAITEIPGTLNAWTPATMREPRAPQDLLWDNGPLVTHPGGGYGGADASAVQTVLSLHTGGFRNQISANESAADDFTIDAASGWTIDSFTFYGYQVHAPYDPSLMNDVRVQIWDGDPMNNPAAQIVWGDLTTNRFVSETWPNLFRALDTDLLDPERALVAVVANVGTTLPQGTYWVQWMLGGSGAYTGPWAPPVTILGQTQKPGSNGLLNVDGTWQAALDHGNAVQQDLAFMVYGTPIAPVDVPWLFEDPTSGEDDVPVAVTLDPTGMEPGAYYATLQIDSNDAANPTIYVPVTMTIIAREAGVLLMPETEAMLGDPGVSVAYTLTLENTGNIPDTFTVEASGVWDVSLSGTSFDLEAGETADVMVEVTIPADAMAGEHDLTTVTATSTFDPNVSAVSELTTTANQLVSIELMPATAALLGAPGEVMTYTLTITNTGNGEDIVDLSLADNLWDTEISVTSVALAADESAEVSVRVTIPADAMAGEYDLTTVTATSTFDPNVSAESELTTTASQTYGIELTPATVELSAAPGEVATYTLTVTNTGNGEDTVALSLAGNLWDAELSVTSVVLAAGESAEVSVLVTVPADAMAGEYDLATVTASSTFDPSVSALSNLTTTANQTYGIELAPATAELSGAPGDVLTYTLTITNTGNGEDTVDLALTGNVWTTTLSAVNVVLAAGDSAEVTVLITIPVDAVNNDFDVVTVRATSEGGPMASSELTSTAVAVVPEGYLIQLPIVVK